MKKISSLFVLLIFSVLGSTCFGMNNQQKDSNNNKKNQTNNKYKCFECKYNPGTYPPLIAHILSKHKDICNTIKKAVEKYPDHKEITLYKCSNSQCEQYSHSPKTIELHLLKIHGNGHIIKVTVDRKGVITETPIIKTNNEEKSKNTNNTTIDQINQIQNNNNNNKNQNNNNPGPNIVNPFLGGQPQGNPAS